MPIDFDKQEYWHQRFATETQFEWLVPSSTFMAIIEPYLEALLTRSATSYSSSSATSSSSSHEDTNDYNNAPLASPPRLLQIGFGTSDLQNHLRARGLPPSSILNIDYEPLALDRGRHLEKQTFGDVRMQYAVADATQLQILHESLPLPSFGPLGEDRDTDHHPKFDLVLDKSTVDAVSCGGEDTFLRMARGVRQVLAPGGVWISLSYSSTRFDVEGLPFEVEVLNKILTPKARSTDPDIYYWCYLLRPIDGE